MTINKWQNRLGFFFCFLNVSEFYYCFSDVEDMFFEPRDVAIRTDKWVTEEFKVFELLGR